MVDFDFDILLDDKEPIDITPLLDNSLPVRMINLLKNEKFYSIESFYKSVENLKLQHLSSYLFPNYYISFYPQVKERYASTDLTCCLSGAMIKKGSLYCNYSPFIENLKTGRVYTISKKLHAEICYIDYLPKDLGTYEEWYYKLKNSYFENNNDPIDFYFLSCECGENCLDLHMLGKSKKKAR